MSKGFMPERLQLGLCLLSVLTIAKQVGSGLGFNRFDIHLRDKVGEERNILLHVGPDFID